MAGQVLVVTKVLLEDEPSEVLQLKLFFVISGILESDGWLLVNS